MEIFQPFLGYYFFNVLLMVLQALHVFWAYLILRMAYKFIFLGKVRVHVKRTLIATPYKRFGFPFKSYGS